jgi:uncharacterized protein GlcG (DUF336 family)
VLCQVAQVAARTKGCHFQVVFRKRVVRLGYNKAIWAVAWNILHHQVRYIEHSQAIKPNPVQIAIQHHLRALRRLGHPVTPQHTPASFSTVRTGCYTGRMLADKKVLTLAAAKRIAAAAEHEAAKNGWDMFIAIVDDGGNLMYLERMDNAQLGSLEVSIQKARSALLFKRPTKAMEDVVAGGRIVVMKLANAVPVEGGVPLVADGKVVGAIGISGATSSQDGIVAKAGADELLRLLHGSLTA